jgi:uncharacterized protein YqjF (DUF2071 family)
MMRQTWSDLLFAHWRVPEDELRVHVPPPLEIDTYEGAAFLAVVPFLMTGIRGHFLPPIPGTSRTLELNVRTYVRYGGRAGVYFLSLDAANGRIVQGGRWLYGLPYYHAEMKLQKATYTRYESLRRDTRALEVGFRGLYRPIAEPRAAEPGSLEHFLTERYCLFTAHKGDVRIGEIDHAPWPLQRAEAEFERNDMTEPFGLFVDNRPLLHYAASIDVKLWPMVKAGA